MDLEIDNCCVQIANEHFETLDKFFIFMETPLLEAEDVGNSAVPLLSSRRRFTRRRIFYLFLGIIIGACLSWLFIRRYYRPVNSLEKEHPIMESDRMHVVPHLDPNVDYRDALRAKIGEEDSAEAPFVFHATDEWQPIPQGALLPGGLDIKINFATGERLARNHFRHAPDPETTPVVVGTVEQPGKTVIEEYLDQVLSDNEEEQWSALGYLEQEATNEAVGAAIILSRNFDNLFTLLDLDKGQTRNRLAVTSIIIKCISGNVSAAEGFFTSESVPKLVTRLSKEKDERILRRIFTIFGVLSESDNPATLHQISIVQGFTILEGRLQEDLLISTLEAAVSMLAVLARDTSRNQDSVPLMLIDQFLPKLASSLHGTLKKSMIPICTSQVHSSRYPNIVAFCNQRQHHK